MRAVIGMTEMFRGMDLKICDELGEEWKRHLLDDKPDYKEQILLSLKMDYNSIDNMIRAGYTEEMLETTKKNVEKYGVEKNVEIIRQDIHNLIFEDETFDMVISRNVTWTIDDPHKVYGEWLRVLKPGGCFLNFDSNFLFSLYDEELQKQYKEDEKEAISQGYEPVPNDHLADGMDEVLPNLPTAKGRRPGWDVNQLMDYEFNNILIDKNVHEGLLSGFDEILHRNSKMFLLRVEK